VRYCVVGTNKSYQYVCWNGNFLCPIVAGEPLSYCSGACYSKFMYTCSSNVLTLLPAVPGGSPFSLTAWNPTLTAVHNKPVTACNLRLSIGGQTCSFCPSQVGTACPAGTTTVLAAPEAMDVEVPGGQAVYLDPFNAVGYTIAHSAQIPAGSTVGGLQAYQGGGYVNLNSGGWGWVACPPTASGGGGNNGWNLVAKNASNAANLGGCTAINLQVHQLPSGTIGAWEYT